MTGPVEWQTLIFICGLIVAAFMAGILTLWRVVAWASAELDKRDTAIDQERQARELAAAAERARTEAETAQLRQQIVNNQLYAVEHFATEEGVGKAFDAVRASIEKLADRLDRVLSRDDAHPSRRST
jgi:hypothetical protein